MRGLTTEEAAESMERYGPNEIAQKVVKWYTILFKQFTSSMAIMIEVAMVLAVAIQEWEDFSIIASLLAINASIGFYEEWEALQKVEGIKSALAPMTNASSPESLSFGEREEKRAPRARLRALAKA